LGRYQLIKAVGRIISHLIISDTRICRRWKEMQIVHTKKENLASPHLGPAISYL
jgi:hypothetical protein